MADRPLRRSMCGGCLAEVHVVYDDNECAVCPFCDDGGEPCDCVQCVAELDDLVAGVWSEHWDRDASKPYRREPGDRAFSGILPSVDLSTWTRQRGVRHG